MGRVLQVAARGVAVRPRPQVAVTYGPGNTFGPPQGASTLLTALGIGTVGVLVVLGINQAAHHHRQYILTKGQAIGLATGGTGQFQGMRVFP